VLEITKPDRIIFVTDGAEDEFILPILSSRAKIDSVRRVVVRQHKDVESTLYIIGKALKDEKVQRKLGVPIALILMVWALTELLAITAGYPRGLGWVSIAFILGLYVLVVAFRLEEPFIAVGRDLKSAIMRKQYIKILSAAIATVLACYGVFVAGYSAAAEKLRSFPEFIVIWIDCSLWFLLGAALTYTIGKTIDIYVRRGKFLRSTIVIVFSVLCVGYIASALLEILQYLLGTKIYTFAAVTGVFFEVLAGGVFGFIAIMIWSYIKGRYILPSTHAAPSAAATPELSTKKVETKVRI
jgi:putative membrane protein